LGTGGFFTNCMTMYWWYRWSRSRRGEMFIN